MLCEEKERIIRLGIKSDSMKYPWNFPLELDLILAHLRNCTTKLEDELLLDKLHILGGIINRITGLPEHLNGILYVSMQIAIYGKRLIFMEK